MHEIFFFYFTKTSFGFFFLNYTIFFDVMSLRIYLSQGNEKHSTYQKYQKFDNNISNAYLAQSKAINVFKQIYSHHLKISFSLIFRMKNIVFISVSFTIYSNIRQLKMFDSLIMVIHIFQKHQRIGIISQCSKVSTRIFAHVITII